MAIFLSTACVTTPLLLLRRHGPSLGACLSCLRTTDNWRTTGCSFLSLLYTHYEYKTGGKNHTKGNWWETPSLIAYTDTAYKLFGQGFIAANIYAEFCERSLLWCAATLIIEEKKTWASAAQGFGKCLMIFCPVTCFGKFARSKLTCVCLGEGRCQTCKAYSTTIFCRPGYFRNVAIGCSESHASLQKILDCVLVSSVSVWEFKSNEES